MTHRCLVVEDSPMMRRLMGFALKRIPALDVVEAVNGADAIKKLAQSDFDLIITDLNMPVMDGLKLIKHVRASDRHASTPVLVVTTERGAEDRQRALGLGANAYITKPLQAPEIIANVKQVLQLD